ncbi:activator of 90 kDa heat shock protein ATPase homolog 1-like [Xenia sp. Carnegie-2017]|uniref:activator of 90 kDa heat shock protein ATPase homolog 1-like n=1 Tax=Xenia sp. Carnegie-2017 TaxID=2897299 RepID=UPI001F03B888|nr:activator of 90 kDa heat shock protein ATPase homolog 1-like [Xenia sp. Carnegie-2017]
MAKWGEGDPRWIVEEREDAKNVNNWHWSEKNATPWSKARLKELFTKLQLNFEGGECEIVEVTKLEGEATANNRKAKLIFFYEWEMSLEWSGSLTDGDDIIKGTIKIPNLSEENEPEDITIVFSTEKENEESYKLKQLLIKHGTPLIRKNLSKYIKELREEFSQGLVLPTKTSTNKVNINNDSSISKEFKKAQINDAKPQKKDDKSVGCRIETTKFSANEEFLTSAGELYHILTNEERVKGFSRSDVKMDSMKGGSFVMFGGTISGKFLELLPDKKITMLWRFKNWPTEHYSTVTMELYQKDDRTELKFTQTGIPKSDLERTKQGWTQYYWSSIRHTFGIGLKYF